MGAYDSHHTGRIMIAPPLTWAEIRSATAGPLQDLHVGTTETVQDTPTGRLTAITGDAIVPLTSSPYSGYWIQAELQSIIDAFPAHDFAGSIEARPEDPSGMPWRFIIRDRIVVRQEARYDWHDES